MKILAEIEIPDDFYVTKLPYPRLIQAIRARLDNAIGNEWPFARMNAVRINEVYVTNLPWSIFGPCPYCGEKDSTKFVIRKTEGFSNLYGCGSCNIWWNFAKPREPMGPQALQTTSEDNKGRG